LQEKRNILSNELGKIHISKSSCHDHFFISTWRLRSLGVTGSSQYRENISQTEIIMSLLGKLLLTKLVKYIKLERELNKGIITD
jgi:hypothetical protein